MGKSIGGGGIHTEAEGGVWRPLRWWSRSESMAAASLGGGHCLWIRGWVQGYVGSHCGTRWHSVRMSVTVQCLGNVSRPGSSVIITRTLRASMASSPGRMRFFRALSPTLSAPESLRDRGSSSEKRPWVWGCPGGQGAGPASPDPSGSWASHLWNDWADGKALHVVSVEGTFCLKLVALYMPMLEVQKVQKGRQ